MKSFYDNHRSTQELLDQAMLGCQARHELRTNAMFARFAGELRRHIQVEEDVLIPLFEAHTDLNDIDLATLILRDHREIEHALERIGEMLARRDDFALVEQLLLALRELLLEHDHREEGQFYPACDRFFTEAELRASLRALPPGMRPRDVATRRACSG